MEDDHPLSAAMAANDQADHDFLVIHANVGTLAMRYWQRRLLQRSAAGVVVATSLFVGFSYLYGHTHRSTAAGTATVDARAVPPASEPPADQVSQAERVAMTTFFVAGYDREDAARLALLWKTESITTTEIAAGEQLLDKRPLPFPPTSPVYDGQTPEEATMVDAFFAEGYDSGDARQLAELWKTASAYEAKVEAGKKLLDGEDLPIRP